MPLAKLIETVADGQPLDWEALNAKADAKTRRLLQHLRLLADVADVHRSSCEDPEASTHVRSEPPPDRSGARWGHLLLVERIGEGAYGEVYRARDPWLDRHVALKLLKPGVADRVPASRILGEARTLARVRHPNVVCVHGADMHDGRLGLWMELVQGRTLSQLLKSQGTFSAREATVIGAEVCRALSAVHAAGIVHRDIKAQNVMREAGGRLVLMDFGAGGTPLYLAPELLAREEPTVASDLYAVGVLLYYLVTGHFHVSGTSLQELEAAHARRDYRRLADQRADLPDDFVDVVERALNPDPRRRYQTAGELLEALAGRRPDVRSTRLTTARSTAEDRGRSIAVLPFAELSESKHLDYFCEGIAEEISSALNSVRGLRVVGSSAALRSASSVKDVQQVASLLNVGAVLEGSVRASDERLRVVARLVDTSDGSQLWTQRFDFRLDDVFAVQEQIAAAAVQALGMSADEASAPGPLVASAPSVRNIDAYTLYLKGRHCWNQRTEGTLQKSVGYFLAALEKEPRYPEALAGLAEAYATLGLYGVLPPHEIMPKAKGAAERAIGMIETISSPHATSGCIASVYDWNWQEAEQQFQRAFELNLWDPLAHHWYAINHLVPLRRFSAARRELQRAAEADPLSMPIRFSFGLTSYFEEDFARAAREIRESLELDPGASTAHLFLGLTLVELGQPDEAAREIETAHRLSPSPEMTAALGYAAARAGQTERAREALHELQALSSNRYISPSLLAQVSAALGDTSGALAALERAVAAHASDLAWLRVRPVFAALRTDPEFAAILRRLGLN
jgi:serine/threonine protein kinase/Flp pilus assembly protein TadD